MGGQEFGADTLLIDVRRLNRILDLNRQTGVLEVEAGIEWPELIAGRRGSLDDFRNHGGKRARSRPEDETIC